MSEFVSAGGGRLAYDTAGAGAPPMIFVHGWGCDRSYFAPQFAHFAAGHAVATLDLRGHGDSSRPVPGPGSRYDIEVLADDLLAVADAADLSRPAVVGHSLGALVGLACAARPGAICALLMVDPAPITNEEAKAFFLESVDAVDARRRRGRVVADSVRARDVPAHRRGSPGGHHQGIAGRPTGDRGCGPAGNG